MITLNIYYKTSSIRKGRMGKERESLFISLGCPAVFLWFILPQMAENTSSYENRKRMGGRKNREGSDSIPRTGKNSQVL